MRFRLLVCKQCRCRILVWMCTNHSSTILYRINFCIFAVNWSVLICLIVMIGVIGRQVGTIVRHAI
uniref:Uncharacterized protein n=1 Tax=Arundo donax TaxID=35708 RepID=A0A0A9BW28_ARUDO